MSIATRIESIEEHIGNAYDELQGLGADLTNVNKNIENISMVLDDIYDSLPSVSDEGTSLTLDDTRVGKIKSTLKGNTSQTTYSGKNKLDLTGITAKTLQAGITITPNFNGSLLQNIKLSGTPTATGWLSYKSFTLDAGSYTLNGINVSNTTKTGLRIGIYIDNDRQWFITSNSPTYTFTLNETTTCQFVIWVQNVDYYPTGDIYITPMVRLSSVTDSTYEPYTGGQASPNPDYPQDIHVVSGNNTIKVTGKNLAYMKNGTYTYNHNTGVISNNNIMTLNTSGSTGSDSYFSFANGYTTQWAPTSNIQGINDMNLTSNGGDYVATVITNKTMPSAVNIYFWTSKGRNWQRRIDTYTKVVATMSLDEDEHIKDIGIWVAGSPNVFENYTIQVQLEKGSTATDYEPYNAILYPINLGMKNLWNSEDMKIGFLPQSGSYPTTNPSFPDSKYILVPLMAGQKLTLSGSSNVANSGRVRCIDKDTNQVVNAFTSTDTEYYTTTHAFGDGFYDGTITAKKDFIAGIMDYAGGGSSQNLIVNYGATAQTITDNPIELCKIGNYQDYFYKDGGKWYLHKEIGKVIFNGTESWTYALQSNVSRFDTTITNATSGSATNNPILSTHFKTEFALTNGRIFLSGYGNTIAIMDNDFSNKNDFKNWLSSNNVTCYYGYTTPTNTEITYQPLIDQLNLLEKAMSKDSQTNISQVNNDLPFIISASALKEWSDENE